MRRPFADHRRRPPTWLYLSLFMAKNDKMLRSVRANIRFSDNTFKHFSFFFCFFSQQRRSAASHPLHTTPAAPPTAPSARGPPQPRSSLPTDSCERAATARPTPLLQRLRTRIATAMLRPATTASLPSRHCRAPTSAMYLRDIRPPENNIRHEGLRFFRHASCSPTAGATRPQRLRSAARSPPKPSTRPAAALEDGRRRAGPAEEFGARRLDMTRRIANFAPTCAQRAYNDIKTKGYR